MYVAHDVSRVNCIDFLMLAGNDFYSAGGIVLTFRFKEPHNLAEIREALRYMFSMYPRLRSVVEPTLFSYRLHILEDDDPQMDALFDKAFRVEHDLRPDTERYHTYLKALLNEPFTLQHELPLKIRYLPDDPRPMLLISLNHGIGDGMSWLHLENSLLRYLNGDKPPLLPLDNSSMLPAFLRRPYLSLPYKLYRSYLLFKLDIRSNKGRKMISASSRPADFFGPVDACIHTHEIDLERLTIKCKELGISKSVLLITALAMIVSRGPGRDYGDLIGISLPFNLRPFFEKKQPVFGNFVTGFWIMIPRVHWDQPRQLLDVIQDRMDTYIDRFNRNEMMIPTFLNKLQSLAGKKIFARVAGIAKQKGKLPISCAFTAIGSIDQVNMHGTKAQVCETMALSPHYGLFLVATYLENKLSIGFIYPEAEFNREEIKHIIKEFDKSVETLLQLSTIDHVCMHKDHRILSCVRKGLGRVADIRV